MDEGAAVRGAGGRTGPSGCGLADFLEQSLGGGRGQKGWIEHQ